MAARSGEEMAVTLLRALPADVAEQVLGRLDPAAAERLRSALPATPAPPPADDLDPALTEFFDLLRIADRARSLPPAGEYRPTADKRTAKVDEFVEPPPPDPIDELRELSPERLLKVLDGEPAAAAALVLTVLDPPAAGVVMKGLPAELRAQVALRFSQPGQRNYAVVRQLARAIVEKGRRVTDLPADTPADARIADLATMLRALPRSDRSAVFQTMSQSDQALADRVRQKLFKFSDVAKVEDRALQGMLQQLNLKTIAVALKGADDSITIKVTSNISGRARELLQEEVSLLGSVSATQVEESRKEILQLLLKAEEEGAISLEG
jgi:flagellar motor switch protein FliG